jgi:type VI secretion system secreted protein VgrG
MKAKTGKKIEAVKPVKPEEAFEADEADPGTVAKVKAKQVSSQKGKYGQTKAPAFKPHQKKKSAEKEAEDEPEKETTWIEIKLVDEDGNVVVGEQYEIELPDGSVSRGTLGGDGTGKVEGFEPGQCKVRFPNIEDDCVSAK